MINEEKEFELWAYDEWEEACENWGAFGKTCQSFATFLAINETRLRKEFRLCHYTNTNAQTATPSKKNFVVTTNDEKQPFVHTVKV